MCFKDKIETDCLKFSTLWNKRIPRFQAEHGNAISEALPLCAGRGGRASRATFLSGSQERETQHNIPF